MKVAVGRPMFSFLQRKGKDLNRRGEEKSPANLKKPPLSNGPDTTSFISALAGAEEHLVLMGNVGQIQAAAFQSLVQLLLRGPELIIPLDAGGV